MFSTNCMVQLVTNLYRYALGRSHFWRHLLINVSTKDMFRTELEVQRSNKSSVLINNTSLGRWGSSNISSVSDLKVSYQWLSNNNIFPITWYETRCVIMGLTCSPCLIPFIIAILSDNSLLAWFSLKCLCSILV